MSYVDPKLIQEKRNLEQDLSLSFVKDDIGAIHSIYFDLTLLQDVYLGALYLHTKDKNDYNKVLHTLPYYQCRIDKEVCKYFPFIENIDDQYLFDFIRNVKKQDLLYKASPHTNLWFYIPVLMSNLIERNRVIDGYEGFHCDIYINLYPTNYPAQICKIINKYLKHISNNISLKTVNMPFEELPASIRHIPDMYFIEDIGTILSTDSSIANDTYGVNAYENKFVYSRKLITTNPEVDIVTSLEKTRYFANIFMYFDYIDIFFPGIEYVPAVKLKDLNEETVVHSTT